ncbi:DUF5342 family protein [Geomicrobium sp. JCM 19055]
MYHGDGQIKWKRTPEVDLEKIEAHIHDLMLYHEFEEHQPPQ